MRNDLERDLRELFDTRALDGVIGSELAPLVRRRARRRQARMILVVAAGIAAIAVGSVAGFGALKPSEPKPAHEEVLTTRSAVLPYGSISYPTGWYLVDLDGRRGGSLSIQLTNFDPGLDPFDCASDPLPPGGVVLRIRPAVVEWAADPIPWPVDLEEQSGSCSGPEATWSDQGRDFAATLSFAPDASAVDRRAVEAAFASLRVAPPRQPFVEALVGAPALVLDSMDSPVGPAVMYAYRDGRAVWVTATGPAGSDISGILDPLRGEPPRADEQVGMNSYGWGGFAFGVAATTVTRAEVETAGAGTFPATLVPLPASLEVTDRQMVWGFVDEPVDDAAVTLYDAAGNLLMLSRRFPVGARIELATGRVPGGGRWTVFLEPQNVGMGFGMDSPTRLGRSMGCCLVPFHSGFDIDTLMMGWGSEDHPSPYVIAFAAEDVDRIVFETGNGSVDGALFPVADPSVGVAQVAVVFIPVDLGLPGDLVAFDAQGNEIQRRQVL